MISKAEFALIRSLSDKKVRQEQGLFLVEGPKMVAEALESGWTVVKAWSTDGSLGDPATNKEMERASLLRTPSTALALVRLPEYARFDPAAASDSLVLALDGVQDPGNVGSILRTAEWFGVEQVVCSLNTADCFSPKVVQATMGSVFRVKVCYTELVPALEAVALQGGVVMGAMLEGEDISKAELPRNGVLVMGSEGGGLSKEVAGLLTRSLYIPRGKSGDRPESLNVAAATAILLSRLKM